MSGLFSIRNMIGHRLIYSNASLYCGIVWFGDVFFFPSSIQKWLTFRRNIVSLIFRTVRMQNPTEEKNKRILLVSIFPHQVARLSP